MIEYSKTVFLKMTFLEAAVTPQIIRVGIALRHHPLSVSCTLAVLVFSVTIGMTRRPKDLMGTSTRRRREDGFVRPVVFSPSHTNPHTRKRRRSLEGTL